MKPSCITSVILLWLCCMPTVLRAQSMTIRGRVTEQGTGRAVSAASVILSEHESRRMITFAQTADDGSYELRFHARQDSVRITVRAMTIEGRSRVVSPSATNVDFVVRPKTTQLKEVVVRAPKIRQRGDTVIYAVGQYLDATDRNIGDVLRKLPGVRVLQSGQVLYQDKPISKFYVEGLDMLEGKYGLATNNIDARQVSRVEVLENHQPVKVLKGMELPDAAAINIKLKQSALGAFFATAQVGAGLKPLILSNELVGMQFGRGHQTMIIYKGDNSGRDVSRELTSFYEQGKDSGLGLLSIHCPAPPGIREQYYLQNDQHMSSLNLLKAWNKELTANINLNYLHDNDHRHHYSLRHIHLTGGNPIEIEELTASRRRTNDWELTMKVESNADSMHLYNRTNADWQHTTTNGSVTQSGAAGHIQSLQSPSFGVSNRFDYQSKRSDFYYSAASYVTYRQESETLDVQPALFPRVPDTEPYTAQIVRYRHLNTNHSLSGNVRSLVNHRITLGLKTSHQTLQSELCDRNSGMPYSADTLCNDLHRHDATFYLQTILVKHWNDHYESQLNLPIDYQISRLEDVVRHQSHVHNYLLFNPYMTHLAHWNMYWSGMLLAGFDKHVAGFTSDYNGYIMTDYRTFMRNEVAAQPSYRTYATASLRYKSPYTGFFASLRVNASNLYSRNLNNVFYQGIFSSNRLIAYPHHSITYGIGTSIGSDIASIRSHISFDASYGAARSVTMLQQQVIPFDSHTLRMSPSVTTQMGKWLIWKYNATYSLTKTTLKNQPLPIRHYLEQQLGCSIIPHYSWVINVMADHYLTAQKEAAPEHTYFACMGVKYIHPKVEVLLDWTNILNAHRYISQGITATTAYYAEYRLRPAEILLRMRFKLF